MSLLVVSRRNVILPPVRFSLLFSLFLPLVFLAGCVTPVIEMHYHPHDYYLVQVTNPRGEVVTNWIAEGKVWQTWEHYYRFRAVERNTAGPYPQQIHYPDGRYEETSGANIHVTPCGKPLWLYESDNEK
jgi:hypothetical protein